MSHKKTTSSGDQALTVDELRKRLDNGYYKATGLFQERAHLEEKKRELSNQLILAKSFFDHTGLCPEAKAAQQAYVAKLAIELSTVTRLCETTANAAYEHQSGLRRQCLDGMLFAVGLSQHPQRERILNFAIRVAGESNPGYVLTVLEDMAGIILNQPRNPDNEVDYAYDPDEEG